MTKIMKRIGRQLSNDELRAYEDQTPKVYSVKLIELQRNFIRLLATGWVQFWYVKKNLQRRRAIGTLNLALIPHEHWPKENIDMPKPTQLCRYYDYEKEQWRTVRMNHLTSFVNEALSTQQLTTITQQLTPNTQQL